MLINDQIRMLHTIIEQKRIKGTLAEKHCSACMEPIKGSTTLFESCGHSYHPCCLKLVSVANS